MQTKGRFGAFLRQNWKRIVRLSVLLLVVLASYLWFAIVTQGDTQIIYDPPRYIYVAHRINAEGLAAAYDTLRTYGYPLCLAVLMWVADKFGVDWITLVVHAQFLFHTASALLAVSLLRRWFPERFVLQLGGFALIQLNPSLLELCRQIMSESVTVFAVTVCLWAILSRHALLASAMLGIAIVLRPFHEMWGIVFLASITAVYLAQQVRSHGVQEALSRLRNRLRRLGLYRILRTATPCFLIVGVQLILVYRYEHRLSVSPRDYDAYQDIHLSDGTYVFKFESYDGPLHDPQVFYVSPQRKSLLDEKGSFWRLWLEDPVGDIYMTTVKTVGLFQTYERVMYRTTLDNGPSFIFGWGLLPFWAFVYALQSLLLGLPLQHLRDPVVILLIAIGSYVLIYSVFAVPESRFIAPIIPLLMVLGLSIFASSRQWRPLLLAGAVSAALYFAAYALIISSQT